MGQASTSPAQTHLCPPQSPCFRLVLCMHWVGLPLSSPVPILHNPVSQTQDQGCQEQTELELMI